MRLPLGFLLLAPTLFAAAKDVPSWVEEMATRPLPSYSGKTPAAVLLEDQHVTLNESGVLTLYRRSAIKILNQEGKREAFVTVHYWKNRRDVKDLRAWIVAPGGFEKTFDKNSILDVGAYNDAEIYTDGRFRAIRAENPEIGAVFAYEYTVEQKALTAQDEFYFQSNLPVLQSRYTLTLPPGWTAQAVVFNQPPLAPVRDGASYIWELKNLPYRDAEDDSASTVPRLAVSFLPPAGAASNTAALASWRDVSRWQSSLAQGQDEPTPEIAAKAAQLTLGAKSDFEKLAAIARYVQNIRYVAIEMNLENGGGYVPHPAALVLAKQYGDCKDKANLMRSLLKASGLESYLVAIFSGDSTHVRPEWPSPYQFNHMILAARVPDSVAAPTAVSTPVGRLLIFDPTDDTTPLGDLPWHEQSSYALLLAGDRGALLQMPSTRPEANLFEVTVEAALYPDGKLAASVVNSKTGQPASRERRRHVEETGPAYQASYQRFINENAKGAVISKLAPDDDFGQNRFSLKMDFASPNYAQLMQGRLLVFNPAVVALPPSIAPYFPKEEKRVSPIVIRSSLYRKTVRIALPPGFSVDELPSPAQLESGFAQFSLTFKQEPGALVMTEELRSDAATLSPDQFQQVKRFFDQCHGADRQNAVLLKN